MWGELASHPPSQLSRLGILVPLDDYWPVITPVCCVLNLYDVICKVCPILYGW